MSDASSDDAFQGVPVGQWGRKMLDCLPKAYDYLQKTNRDWEEYQKDLKYFETQWKQYLKLRDLLEHDKPKFPVPFGVPERDEFYKSLSWDGWGGSSGHVSCLSPSLHMRFTQTCAGCCHHRIRCTFRSLPFQLLERFSID